jgi:hypothetical protein
VVDKMAKPKIVVGSEKKGKPKIVEEETEWDMDKVPEGAFAATSFSPRKKGPGDLIQADDWNNIQIEIKDDLMNIASALNKVASKSQFLIASGVSSHGMFVQLNWGVKPHILLSYSGPLDGANGEVPPIRCYPYAITGKGFKIHAQSDDGKAKGIVNWIAIGVIQ